MLQITLPEIELWDEVKQEFVASKEQVLQLEHSLISLQKWESKWHKAFMSKDEKSFEETMDYIKCMTLTQNVKPETYNRLTREHIAQINEYIADPMTATYFHESESKTGGKETITAELIYYWMSSLNINWECRKWHLNQLITLIRVCSLKNAPPKKMNKRDIMSRNAALNAARRRQYNSKG